MRHKTVYIPDEDSGLWAAAQRVADRRGISVSRIVAEALDDYLPRAAETPAQQSDRWAHIAADAA